MAPSLLDLPSELVGMIAEELIEKAFSNGPKRVEKYQRPKNHNHDIQNFRVTCRKLDADCLHAFCKRFTSNLELIITRQALEGLVTLSKNPTIASKVQTLIFMPHYLPAIGLAPRNAYERPDPVQTMINSLTADRRETYIRQLEEQDLEDGFLNQGLLVSALSRFPNCHNIVVQDCDWRDRSRGSEAKWDFSHFYGAGKLAKDSWGGHGPFYAKAI